MLGGMRGRCGWRGGTTPSCSESMPLWTCLDTRHATYTVKHCGNWPWFAAFSQYPSRTRLHWSVIFKARDKT